MRSQPHSLRFLVRRQAFTLVEILTVSIIIAMLVLLTMAAVNKVALSVKITKTNATIQKLDAALKEIVETYGDTFSRIRRQVEQNHPLLSDEDRLSVALHFIWDTMRMEMPQSWTETQIDNLEWSYKNGTYLCERSPLMDHYQYTYARMAGETQKTPQRSALLFLIIQNLNPDALEAFHSSEVTDTDGDGLLEFVDAWGNPLHFLRWAPGLTDSLLQQDVPDLCDPKYRFSKDLEVNRNWWIARSEEEGGSLNAMKTASINHPYLLEGQNSQGQNNQGQGERIGWFLYPIIYSAGPDGEYGIDAGNDLDGSPALPYIGEGGKIDPYAFPFGMPDGTGSHFDNITNHHGSVGF